MAHAPHSRRAATALLASLIVVAMAPAAALAGPATDEYKLDLPDVERASLETITGAADDVEPGAKPTEPFGVVAESAPAERPLEATGSLLPLLGGSLLFAGAAFAANRIARSRGERS